MVRYNFDLRHQDNVNEMFSNQYYQYNLIKNKALLTGDANVVRHFYRKVAVNFGFNEYIMQEIYQSFFYREKTKNAYVFYGIVKMINDGIVRLITSGGIKNITVQKNNTEDIENTKRLKKILEINEHDDYFELGESIQSGLGDLVYRIVYDPEIQQEPLLELFDPAEYEIIMKRGRFQGVLFKRREQIEDTPIEYHEVYEKTLDGTKITHKFWDCSSDPKEIKMDDTDRCKRIAQLFNVSHLYNGNKFIADEIMTGVFPIVFKKNTGTNTMYFKSGHGVPDTHGLETLESALSEALSDAIDEIRKAGLKVFISDKLLKHDKDGRQYDFDYFDKEIVTLSGESDEASKLFQIMKAELNSTHFLDTAKSLVASACNKAGIHPLTVGITGLESIAAGAESQTEREGKTSLRKRELKLRDWLKTHKTLFKTMLQVDDWINGNKIEDYDIIVEYGQYSNPSTENIIATLGKAVELGIMSIQEAQGEFFKDIPLEERRLIYIKTKVEKGMPLTDAERNILDADSSNPVGE